MEMGAIWYRIVHLTTKMVINHPLPQANMALDDD